MKSNLTQSRLKELLHYEPETGYFTWRIARNSCSPVGGRAGTLNRKGYRVINIDRALHLAHRLAVFYMLGRWPTVDVDHERGDHDDNRWSKLRELSRAENMQNLRAAHRDNKTGMLGIAPVRDRWGAYICTAGKRSYLGSAE